MKHYRIKALSVSGKGKSIFRAREVVAEDRFPLGSIERLVKQGFIEEMPEKTEDLPEKNSDDADNQKSAEQPATDDADLNEAAEEEEASKPAPATQAPKKNSKK